MKKKMKLYLNHIMGNSLDFNKFVQEHKYLIKPLNDVVKTNNKFIRKFVVKRYDLEQLIVELKRIIIESNNPREELLEMNDKSIEQIVNPLKTISNVMNDIQISNEETKINLDLMIKKFNERMDKIQEENRINNEKLNQNINNLTNENRINNEKLNQNINNLTNENKSIHEEIKEIKTDIKIINNKLEDIYSQYATEEYLKMISNNDQIEIVEIYANYRYRPVIKNNQIYKFHLYIENGQPYGERILTINEISNYRFRDKSGNIYIPNDKRKKRLENKYLINSSS